MVRLGVKGVFSRTRLSGSLHFRFAKRASAVGTLKGLAPSIGSSSNPQLGQAPSKTREIFRGCISRPERTRASSQRVQW